MLQENLIMLRSLAGKTQEDIAEVIGISRQAYAKWERGETIPDIEKCGRLAEFYGVTMDSLIKDDVQGWGKYTTKYEERYIEGGHYEALKNIQQITEKINQIIER